MRTLQGSTVAFFIGSGCSFPSGQPSVREITEACLHGEYYSLEPVDEFSLFLAGLEENHPLWGTKTDLLRGSSNRPPTDLGPWRKPAASIQSLLAGLSTLNVWREKPNYEDLAGALNVIAGSLAQGTNDPFVESFLRISELPDQLQEIEFPQGHRYFRGSTAQQIVVVEDFIGWVIASKLRVAPELHGYQALKAAIRFLQKSESTFHVATTNYDCNLERLFRSSGVEFDDGFPLETVLDDRKRRWRYGNRFRFFESGKPALVKLHGSLNWFMCHDANGSKARMLASIRHGIGPVSGYRSYIPIGSQFLFTPIGCPQMLRGSLSKVLEYSYDVHSQLLMAFEHILTCADLVVVAGFGWNDEGIVARLIRFAGGTGKVVLVFDGTPEAPAIERSHLFDQQMIRRRNYRGPLILVRKHLSELSTDECIRHLKEAMIPSE